MYNRNTHYQMTDNNTTDNDYRQSTYKGRSFDQRTYTEGNVARNINTAPNEEDDDYSEVRKKIRENRNKNKALEERARVARLRRLEASMGMSMMTCITLVAVVIVMMCLLFDYISMKSDVTNMGKEIASKETEYNTLKTKNDSKLKEVEANINLQEIYRIATKDLGMVFADDSQVIKYNKSESAYVRQYEDLPEEAADNVFDDVLSAIK